MINKSEIRDEIKLAIMGLDRPNEQQVTEEVRDLLLDRYGTLSRDDEVNIENLSEEEFKK